MSKPDDISSHDSDRTRVEEQPELARGDLKPSDLEKSHGADFASAEPVLVDWNGADDPANPKNWGKHAQWTGTILASFYTLLAPLTSTITAPAEDQISAAYGIRSAVLQEMLTSIMVLAFAFGPVLFGPLSELYGRRIVLLSANVIYMSFNIACAWAPNAPAFYIFRFLAGVGGSSALSVGGGCVGDIWRPERRGMAMAIYALFPLLGPSFGPIMGAWIAEQSTWKWCFWSTTILSGVVETLGFLFLKETYAPILLERKAARLRLEHPDIEYQTPYTMSERGLSYIISKGLSWPFRLLIHEPILQWIALVQAIYYGLIYLIFVEIPPVHEVIYGESTGIAGLHYIATAIGFITVSQVQGRSLDPIYRYFVAKNGKGRPEYRLPPLCIGACLLPAGFLMFGWAAEKHVFWLVPDIGTALISGGMISASQATQTYVIDTYAVRAASALAVVFFLRAICGFAFPLFAPDLFSSLTLGGGSTLLAGLALIFAVPAAPMLWRFGPSLRRRSRYAKKDDLDD